MYRRKQDEVKQALGFNSRFYHAQPVCEEVSNWKLGQRCGSYYRKESTSISNALQRQATRKSSLGECRLKLTCFQILPFVFCL